MVKMPKAKRGEISSKEHHSGFCMSMEVSLPSMFVGASLSHLLFLIPHSSLFPLNRPLIHVSSPLTSALTSASHSKKILTNSPPPAFEAGTVTVLAFQRGIWGSKSLTTLSRQLTRLATDLGFEPGGSDFLTSAPSRPLTRHAPGTGGHADPAPQPAGPRWTHTYLAHT